MDEYCVHGPSLCDAMTSLGVLQIQITTSSINANPEVSFRSTPGSEAEGPTKLARHGRQADEQDGQTISCTARCQFPSHLVSLSRGQWIDESF